MTLNITLPGMNFLDDRQSVILCHYSEHNDTQYTLRILTFSMPTLNIMPLCPKYPQHNIYSNDAQHEDTLHNKALHTNT